MLSKCPECLYNTSKDKNINTIQQYAQVTQQAIMQGLQCPNPNIRIMAFKTYSGFLLEDSELIKFHLPPAENFFQVKTK